MLLKTLFIYGKIKIGEKMSVLLDVKSCYSLLTGTMRIEQLVAKAKQAGYQAVTLADKSVMHGAMEFFRACQKHQIKPLLGLEVEVDLEEDVVSLLLIAQTNQGYKNLLRCSSVICSRENNLKLEEIKEYLVGNQLIIYGEGGIFEGALLEENSDRIQELLHLFKEEFSHFLVAISNNESVFWKNKNELLKRICISNKVNTVAVPKVLYENEEDIEIAKALMAIKKGVLLQDNTIAVASGRFIRPVADLNSFYEVDDLEIATKIAKESRVDLNIEKASLPKFPTKEGVSSKEYLKELCIMGLRKRFDGEQVPKQYLNRLQYELDVILKMHYEDYFLIVWDFIVYARKNNIYVGPGRGSSAGSLVAYVLGITHVDPIQYGLLFERFLNPERISMPDIDIDFPDDRRDEVIQYVYQKYGVEHIAHIATFGTFGARQAIRDIGRVLGFAVRDVDAISKLVPRSINITLDGAMKESTRFKQKIESERKNQQLFQLAKKIEGLPRHISTHAAGIVMSDRSLIEVVPLIQVEADMLSTQYSMEYLEELGLIKMDFLGLRNLTIIDEILQQIPDKIDILKIPLDDQKTYQMIQDVDTVGIFQLESDGMKNLIRKMKPYRFEDIVVTIALFRPGPMENIGPYLSARQNPKNTVYLHPDLKPILEETYGIMIYQEQIMQVAQKMAGFSLARADILRKAMSKKNEKELSQLYDEFISGCLKNGYTKQLANDLFNSIKKFANYGFNKSHSVAYALIAYQLAYLKANYPLQFFSCLLTSVIGSDRKTSEYISECRRRGVRVLLPSIQKSEEHYTIEHEALRYPLLGIKNVGINATREIVVERKEHGEYEDLYDFVARVNARKVNRKVIESLIDAGALDGMLENRASLIASLDEALSYADLVQIEQNGQIKIDLGLVSKPTPYRIKEVELDRLEREREVLGFFLSNHPIITVKEKQNYQGDSIAQVLEKKGEVAFVGFIQRVKTHRTKHGDLMAFVSVADESGEIDVVLMPRIYQQSIEFLHTNRYVAVTGKIEREQSVLVTTIKVFY